MLIQQPCSFFNLCSCSCLPWAAPRLCCRAPEPVKFPTPLHLRLHCPVFPISGSFQSGCARHGVVNVVNNRESSEDDSTWEADSGDAPRPWTHACNGTRHGQRGQGTTSIGSVLYVERLTAGSTAAARKCLLITRKIIIPPPDSRDPPDGPPVFREKKRFPLTAGTHRTGHRISWKNVPPAVSSDPPEVPPYYAQKNEYSPC